MNLSHLFSPVVTVVLIRTVVTVVVMVMEDAAGVVADGEVWVKDQMWWAASDVDNSWG